MVNSAGAVEITYIPAWFWQGAANTLTVIGMEIPQDQICVIKYILTAATLFDCYSYF